MNHFCLVFRSSPKPNDNLYLDTTLIPKQSESVKEALNQAGFQEFSEQWDILKENDGKTNFLKY